jgi:glucose/mannose transport system permease protein
VIGRSATRSTRIARAGIYTVLLVAAFVALAPAVVMILTSLRPMSEIASGSIIGLPQEPTVEAWQKAWTSACIGTRCGGLRPYFWNSVAIVVPATLLSTALGAINGFALTKTRFPGADLLLLLIVMGCFLPLQAVLIPAAQTLAFLGLANSLAGLVLIYTVYGISFTTLFFRNFYVALPDDIVNAAAVDGAGFWLTFTRVIIPLSWPIVMVSVVFQMTGIWNEFLFGVTFSAGTSQTLMVALNNLVNTSFGAKEYNVDMAAAMIVALPVVIVYLFAGRFLVRGLTAGAVKG